MHHGRLHLPALHLHDVQGKLAGCNHGCLACHCICIYVTEGIVKVNTMLALTHVSAAVMQDAAQVPGSQEEHQEACNSVCTA